MARRSVPQPLLRELDRGGRRMSKLVLGASFLLSLALAGHTRAQTFHAATWEMTVDDDGPDDGDGWGAVGAPIKILHGAALVVRVADFDHDGYDDVLLGGNGGSGVRIYYLDDDIAGWVDTSRTEILDYNEIFACYDVSVDDVNGDGWADVAVGRRLGQTFVALGERDTVFLNRGTSATGDDHVVDTPFALPHDDDY